MRGNHPTWNQPGRLNVTRAILPEPEHLGNHLACVANQCHTWQAEQATWQAAQLMW
jgi:Ni,Fe-hydrogenase III large subunit